MCRLCHSFFLVLCAVFSFAFTALPLRADTAIDVAALAIGDSGEGWTFDGTNLVLSTERQYVAYGTRTLMTIRADADCTLVASNLSVSAVGLAKAGLMAALRILSSVAQNALAFRFWLTQLVKLERRLQYQI